MSKICSFPSISHIANRTRISLLGLVIILLHKIDGRCNRAWGERFIIYFAHRFLGLENHDIFPFLPMISELIKGKDAGKPPLTLRDHAPSRSTETPHVICTSDTYTTKNVPFLSDIPSCAYFRGQVLCQIVTHFVVNSTYDSRVRALMRQLSHVLGMPWEVVTLAEDAIFLWNLERIHLASGKEGAAYSFPYTIPSRTSASSRRKSLKRIKWGASLLVGTYLAQSLLVPPLLVPAAFIVASYVPRLIQSHSFRKGNSKHPTTDNKLGGETVSSRPEKTKSRINSIPNQSFQFLPLPSPLELEAATITDSYTDAVESKHLQTEPPCKKAMQYQAIDPEIRIGKGGMTLFLTVGGIILGKEGVSSGETLVMENDAPDAEGNKAKIPHLGCHLDYVEDAAKIYGGLHSPSALEPRIGSSQDLQKLQCEVAVTNRSAVPEVKQLEGNITNIERALSMLAKKMVAPETWICGQRVLLYPVHSLSWIHTIVSWFNTTDGGKQYHEAFGDSSKRLPWISQDAVYSSASTEEMEHFSSGSSGSNIEVHPIFPAEKLDSHEPFPLRWFTNAVSLEHHALSSREQSMDHRIQENSNQDRAECAQNNTSLGREATMFGYALSTAGAWLIIPEESVSALLELYFSNLREICMGNDAYVSEELLPFEVYLQNLQAIGCILSSPPCANDVVERDGSATPITEYNPESIREVRIILKDPRDSAYGNRGYGTDALEALALYLLHPPNLTSPWKEGDSGGKIIFRPPLGHGSAIAIGSKAGFVPSLDTIDAGYFRMEMGTSRRTYDLSQMRKKTNFFSRAISLHTCQLFEIGRNLERMMDTYAFEPSESERAANKEGEIGSSTPNATSSSAKYYSPAEQSHANPNSARFSRKQVYGPSGFLRQLTPYGEQWTFVWEPELLSTLGNYVRRYSYYTQAEESAELSAKYRTISKTILRGAFSVPRVLTSIQACMSSTWSLALERALEAGVALANTLLTGAHSDRPVVLVGFGLGAKVIGHCLEHIYNVAMARAKHAQSKRPNSPNILAEQYTFHESQQFGDLSFEKRLEKLMQDVTKNHVTGHYHTDGNYEEYPWEFAIPTSPGSTTLPSPFSIVQDAILLGAPLPSQKEMWRKYREVVSGRLVNGYASTDTLLRLGLLCKSLTTNPAGLGPVGYKYKNPVKSRTSASAASSSMEGNAVSSPGNAHDGTDRIEHDTPNGFSQKVSNKSIDYKNTPFGVPEEVHSIIGNGVFHSPRPETKVIESATNSKTKRPNEVDKVIHIALEKATERGYMQPTAGCSSNPTIISTDCDSPSVTHVATSTLSPCSPAIEWWEGIENINLEPFITDHMDYVIEMPNILRYIGLDKLA